MCVWCQSKDQPLNSRSVPKPRVNDGLKMRASVRMTRYLESWGAVKPFAHLQSRESYTTDAMVNGKARCKVPYGTRPFKCRLICVHACLSPCQVKTRSLSFPRFVSLFRTSPCAQPLVLRSLRGEKCLRCYKRGPHVFKSKHVVWTGLMLLLLRHKLLLITHTVCLHRLL